MSKADESAFPIHGNYLRDHSGLTKREYFAAAAMQGLLSAGQGWNTEPHQHELCRLAVVHADALLAELERK